MKTNLEIKENELMVKRFKKIEIDMKIKDKKYLTNEQVLKKYKHLL